MARSTKVARAARMVAWQLQKRGTPTLESAAAWLSEDKHVNNREWITESDWAAFARAFRAEVKVMRALGVL